MSVNYVVLVGRITKDPVLRKTASGTSTCSFNIAVDRMINRKTAPENAVTADFPTCVAWRGTADFMSNFVHKGDLLSVEGRLQTRTYIDPNDNKKVYVTEIIANRVQKLERKNSGQAAQQGQPAQNSGYANMQTPQMAPAAAPRQMGYSQPQASQYAQYQQNAPVSNPQPAYNGYRSQNYQPVQQQVQSANRGPSGYPSSISGGLDITSDDLPF